MSPSSESPSPTSHSPESPSPTTPSGAGSVPIAPPTPARRGKGRLIILGVVIALVLALGTGGLWALTRGSDPLSLVKAPILKAQQDLSNLGQEPTSGSFDSTGTTALVNKQLMILRVIADRRETLVALSLSSSASHAAWQAPVPDELAGQNLNCTMSTKTLDCGERISIDLASGINSPAKPSRSRAAPARRPVIRPHRQHRPLMLLLNAPRRPPPPHPPSRLPMPPRRLPLPAPSHLRHRMPRPRHQHPPRCDWVTRPLPTCRCPSARTAP